MVKDYTDHLCSLSVSPNVEFFVDDIEAPWAFSTNFDFVYLRFMAGCIKDWPKLMTQAFEYVHVVLHQSDIFS